MTFIVFIFNYNRTEFNSIIYSFTLKLNLMKINKENIPVTMEGPDTLMRAQPDLGGMTVGYHQLPKGTDFTPLFKGLANDSCHCPHWGYIFKGTIRIVYNDGSEDITQAGDVFYWKPGHTAIVDEDVVLMDFSPDKELGEVMEQVNKNMAEMG